MRRFSSLVAATAAMVLAAFTCAAQTSPAGRTPAASEQSMPSQAPAEQPMPSEQPSASSPAAPSAAEDSPRPSDSATASSSSAGGPTRLSALVPSGMTAQEACTGFTSVNECLVALHLAQNLSIPFSDLKARLTSGEKLGATVHQLKPGANANAELTRAQEQARQDVRGSQG